MLWDGALAIFSENRVLTFAVILRNKTGGSFQIGPTFVGSFLVYVLQTFAVILRKMTGGPLQIDPNVVGSLYFVFSKLTLCMIRVSLDQKRWQVHSNLFWYNLHLYGKYFYPLLLELLSASIQ